MQDVKVERHRYIGGSDIPTILGINPFKKRFDLLLEKAQLINGDFNGNEYTEYGNIMEPKIREFINKVIDTNFVEDKAMHGDIRCHVDGYDGFEILEIKTTSKIFKTPLEYKKYLVQLLFYMKEYNCKCGKLAVYERPDDFSEVFDAKRLQLFDVYIDDYEELLKEIYEAVEKFRADLEKVKANPFITEDELQPKALIELSNKVVALEQQLAIYKNVESEYKELKQSLFNEMENYHLKSWKTNGGYTITRIDGSADVMEEKEEFDLKAFAKENPYLYQKYLVKKQTTKKGKTGYVKITAPKK